MGTVGPTPEPSAWVRLRAHWQEYLIEAPCLGAFVVAAAAFTTLVEHPASAVRQAVQAPLPRRVLMGAAS